jgi:hypothetical protein
VISYYALFDEEKDVGPAVGLFILEERTGDALLVIRVLDKPRNWRRFKAVDRAEAEIRVMEVTRASLTPLPDEDMIRWMFQSKGAPTQT